MPKVKTKKGFAKRVKVTKKKKILRSRAGRRHLLSCKKRKRKRNLRRKTLVSKGFMKMARRSMPHAF